MRGRDKFTRVEPLLEGLARILGLAPTPLLRFLLRRARRMSGLLGMGVRYAVLHALGCAPASNVSVREDVYLLNTQGLRFGRNVSVHPMCYLDAVGGIDIGNDVSIAHAVSILSSTHNFDDPSAPINDQGVTRRRTQILDNCWVGAQAVIVAGVRVGTGSVIAANSVVTKDVPDNTVVAGSPARVVRSRSERIDDSA